MESQNEIRKQAGKIGFLLTAVFISLNAWAQQEPEPINPNKPVTWPLLQVSVVAETAETDPGRRMRTEHARIQPARVGVGNIEPVQRDVGLICRAAVEVQISVRILHHAWHQRQRAAQIL